jgi:hypothetical protein
MTNQEEYKIGRSASDLFMSLLPCQPFDLPKCIRDPIRPVGIIAVPYLREQAGLTADFSKTVDVLLIIVDQDGVSVRGPVLVVGENIIPKCYTESLLQPGQLA